MENNDILKLLPYSPPFLFVDELLEVTEDRVVGNYLFSRDLDFYQGHFTDFPVTPGVILTECCAQIGLVCLGIFLLEAYISENKDSNISVGLSSSDMDFYHPVLPGEKVTVTSEKVYFRFNKLKCRVKMHNSTGKLVCKGVISGMLKLQEIE
ncbi:3-hydroxyacyl-ACP dehydratase FabZ family protein [Ulvibacterium marinum]|uniref:Hydroxymyristoyl-ACP dehydratase n=1 Tax=Ulvibacterium marinum TaxID=2419782 RepID=A0A3B0CE14_9FLAO|nr:hotdog domain-containing protein [Ulvibacterium marinum]RKN81226.1 hydroxymyristoyl-ACP dehydratase [Ulvibacterium marinum]